MIGAIIGDIVGSVYEFNNIKTKDFPFLTACNSYTDDSLMTIAVGSALMKASGPDDLKGMFVREMRRIAKLYPCPMGGYGAGFITGSMRPTRIRIRATATVRPCGCPPAGK